MSTPPIRIATRRSRLALWQAEHAAAALRRAHPDRCVELVPVTTAGDRDRTTALRAMGGTGLFTKEIEETLLRGDADLAVHSLKDLPTVPPDGLAIAAVLPREDPADALVTRTGCAFADLPAGARLGTGSPRRAGQLRHARPDLVVTGLRGNVETRLQKLETEGLDAIVLALAGLKRLGLADRVSERLAFALCLPAPGQGAIAIETRAGDDASRALAATLHDATTADAVTAERSFLRTLEGGCSVPAGALATVTGDRLRLEAAVAAPDGSALVRDALESPAADATALGARLAEQLLTAGADRCLADARPET
ncbi:MAG: hydroxymethylbilane synthase [Planctomycetota bacterium]